MKLLVTGGAGFIGTHLIEALLSQGHSVDSLDNLSTGSEENAKRFAGHPGYRFAFGDVANENLLSPMVESADVVFHLAACVGVQNVVNDPIHCIETNISGTALVLKKADEFKKRIFTFSTSEVYGKSTRLPFTEDSDIVLGPVHKLRWSYAASKLVDDYLARAYFAKKDLAVTIVRLFNTVGQGQVGHYGMVVPRFFEQAMSRKPVTVYGDGSQTRCFTDVRDVVAALLALIPVKASYGELINIGSSEEVSILQLAERIKQVTGSNSPIEMVPFKTAFGENFEDMDRRVPSTQKLADIAGFKFRYNLMDTLKWVHAGYLVGLNGKAPRASEVEALP